MFTFLSYMMSVCLVIPYFLPYTNQSCYFSKQPNKYLYNSVCRREELSKPLNKATLQSKPDEYVVVTPGNLKFSLNENNVSLTKLEI